MIHSMTAYARREIKGEWGTGTWEIRSVNQRYLETFIRAPEQFRGWNLLSVNVYANTYSAEK